MVEAREVYCYRDAKLRIDFGSDSNCTERDNKVVLTTDVVNNVVAPLRIKHRRHKGERGEKEVDQTQDITEYKL